MAKKLEYVAKLGNLGSLSCFLDHGYGYKEITSFLQNELNKHDLKIIATYFKSTYDGSIASSILVFNNTCGEYNHCLVWNHSNTGKIKFDIKAGFFKDEHLILIPETDSWSVKSRKKQNALNIEDSIKEQIDNIRYFDSSVLTDLLSKLSSVKLNQKDKGSLYGQLTLSYGVLEGEIASNTLSTIRKPEHMYTSDPEDLLSFYFNCALNLFDSNPKNLIEDHLKLMYYIKNYYHIHSSKVSVKYEKGFDLKKEKESLDLGKYEIDSTTHPPVGGYTTVVFDDSDKCDEVLIANSEGTTIKELLSSLDSKETLF
jgi:hypothetical protein